MLSNPIPGNPASVLASVLVTDPTHPLTSPRRATFSLVNFPNLPSLANEVVWVPQYALFDCNGEFTGMVISLGWATKGVTAVTAAYTPLPSDALILVNAASGPVTVTLPDATAPGYSPGQRYTVKKTDSSANAVTVAASAGQLIDGAATVTLTTANAFTSVVFDGVNTANWWTWAAASTGTQPTGAAGGALAGTYPNPALALPVALSAASTSSLLTVTNSTAAPGAPPVQVNSAAAGDRAIGAQVSGDGFLRLRAGSDGKLQWGPGNVTQDTNLYRSAPGVLKTDGTFVAGSQAVTLPWLTGVFGDGSDGSVAFNGTNTFASFATTTGSAPNLAYTLTRDVFATNLTISSGISVTPAGFRFFCQGAFTNSGGTVNAAGNAGLAAGGGAANPGQGSIQSKGGASGTTTAGNAGNGTGAPGLNSSGAGGNGTSGNTGGAAGTAGSASMAWFRNPGAALAGTCNVGNTLAAVCGGPGGGGGGGDGTNKGGGGGSGGGTVVIFAWSASNTGTISTAGGVGGTPATGNCGGGGGGAAGDILVYTLSAWAPGTTTVTGGAGGGGVGTGTAGGAGGAGNVLNVVLT